MKNYLSKINNYSPLDLFDQAFGDFFRPVFYDEKLDSMKTDIKETDEAYELEIEMPGFDKKDISVSLDNGYLTIRAEKSVKDEDEAKHRYVRKERSVSCQRSYYVGDVPQDAIKAKYDNGILALNVPKEVRRKPEVKTIAID